MAQFNAPSFFLLLTQLLLPGFGPFFGNMKRGVYFCRARSLTRKLRLVVENYRPYCAISAQCARHDSAHSSVSLGPAFEVERGRRSGAPSPDTMSVDHSGGIEDCGENTE